MNNFEKITALGQSLWYDNIERRLLENGELAGMVQRGEIRGLTSNPSIFHNAIARSSDYDNALLPMAWAGYNAGQIFEQLAIEDIRAAADLLLPLYAQTDGGDGYVSLEVSPALAHDTAGTLADAKRLWAAVDRPNLMIKIPATEAGLPAIRQALAAGLNINVTLIFSLTRYVQVMDAYLSGLEARLEQGLPLQRIASVASFFVSRIDSKVDARLAEIVRQESAESGAAAGLLGKLAIANAKLAYAEFQQIFGSARFARLQAQGARPQRPLWASTSTKNPAYPDTLYVDSLIGAQTVNTVPPQTLSAFGDHGQARLTLSEDLEAARQVIAGVEALGIAVAQVTQELEDEGVQAFGKAFSALLESIEARRQQAQRSLGTLAGAVAAQVADLDARQAAERIRQVDPSLWTDDPTGQAEVRIRLGWQDAPQISRALLPELADLRTELVAAGFKRALLLGMGGSSLAPEVLSLVADATGVSRQPGLQTGILDSTEPTQVLEAAGAAPLAQTIFIVASKSGGTAEVAAFMDYFWDEVSQLRGDSAGEQFIAVTDPNTALEKLARERKFRRVILADPQVGGRYSALTAFGVTPAVLMGLDGSRLLRRGAWMAAQCSPAHPAGRNPGLVLGALMGAAAKAGRDKLTLIADPAFAPLGAWLEQLIAESSGKQGVGILPVDGELPASPEMYGSDRLFVYLKHSGEYQAAAEALLAAGQPLLTFDLRDGYDLGAEFFRWEYSTAVACAVLGVNAFDQPDVQDSKNRTKAKIAYFREHGRFDEGDPVWQAAGLTAYLSQAAQAATPPAGGDLASLLAGFLALGQPGDYVALNAYLPRNPEMEAMLRQAQQRLRQRSRLATTLGFGPRFLHSTGQLHKGGPGNGLYLELTQETELALPIPGQGLTFGELVRGQALGDFEALEARQRRALRINLSNPQALKRLLEAI